MEGVSYNKQEQAEVNDHRQKSTDAIDLDWESSTGCDRIIPDVEGPSMVTMFPYGIANTEL